MSMTSYDHEHGHGEHEHEHKHGHDHDEHDHGEHDHEHEWDETLTEHGTPVTLSEMRGKDFAHLLEDIDGYLCELTGAQIRGGLHILGQLPLHEQLTDLLFSLSRLPNLGTPSIREAGR